MGEREEFEMKTKEELMFEVYYSLSFEELSFSPEKRQIKIEIKEDEGCLRGFF